MKRHGEDWRAIWQRAHANCPFRLRWVSWQDYDLGEHLYPNRDSTQKEFDAWRKACVAGWYRERYGQLSAMCRLLDLPMLSRKGWVREGHKSAGGKRVGHLRIDAYLQRGSRPRNPEVRRKVQILASPLGPAMAMRKLKQLGIDHLYTKP